MDYGHYVLLSALAFVVMVWRLSVIWTRAPRARKAFTAGVEAIKAGDWTTAENTLRKAVRLEPIWAVGHRLLGRALAENAKLDEAERHFRMAAALEPRNPEGYADLGFFLAFKASGRQGDAVDAFAKAVELAPQFRAQLGAMPQLAPLRSLESFRNLIEPGRPE